MDNANIYQDFFYDSNIDEFIKEHSKSGSCLDDAMITALSRDLNINIVIIRSDNQEPNVFKRPNSLTSVYLGYIVGLHYQSLVPSNSINSVNIEKNIHEIVESKDPDTQQFTSRNLVSNNKQQQIKNIVTQIQSNITSNEEKIINDKASDTIKKFESFKSKLLSDIDSDNFYKNPFYKILSTKDLSGYEKAISLDPIYSFPAYYEKARQKIIKDGLNNKKEILEDLLKAKQIIEEHIIPQLQGVCIMLGINLDDKNDMNNSPIYNQYYPKIDLLKKQIKYINETSNAIKNSTRKILIKNSVSVLELVDNNSNYIKEISELKN